MKLNVPLANAPQGEMTLLCTAAANGLNSTASGPVVAVAEPFVRLVSAGAVATPTKPLAFNRTAKFAVNLRNDGNVAVPSTPPAAYALAVTTDGSDAGTVFTTSVAGAIRLKPAQSRRQTFAVTFASQFAPGSYVLVVKLDAPLNETNGQVVAAIPFTIA
jgi:hypothetical protein